MEASWAHSFVRSAFPVIMVVLSSPALDQFSPQKLQSERENSRRSFPSRRREALERGGRARWPSSSRPLALFW